MNIATFLKCVKMLPPHKSVLIMGGHGIGKSKLVRYAAKLIRSQMNWESNKFPVIDRRLSQMTEGDIIGLPFKVDIKVDGFEAIATRFGAADWFLRTCYEPCLLFLDEGNRASGEVIQAAFQIALDHELNGNVMHPQSRVFMAVNDDSTRYQVTDFDPAFLSRWWVCKLTPTFEEWLEWARDTSEDGGNIHPDIINFLLMHNSMLDPSETAANMEKDTDRRSWEHFSIAYTENGLDQLNLKTPADENFLHQFASGFIGFTAAAGFVAYLKTIERFVTPEEILNDYDRVEDRVKKTTINEIGSINNKLVEWFRKNTLNAQQCENMGKYFAFLPPELAIGLWQDIAKYPGETTTNLKLVHKFINQVILTSVQKVKKT